MKFDWRKVDGYDDILDSLTLSPPDGPTEYVSVRICEGPPSSESTAFPPVDLWLASAHLPKLDRLRKLTQKGIIELGHPVSDPLVESLLPLIPITPGLGREKASETVFEFPSHVGDTNSCLALFARWL